MEDQSATNRKIKYKKRDETKTISFLVYEGELILVGEEEEKRRRRGRRRRSQERYETCMEAMVLYGISCILDFSMDFYSFVWNAMNLYGIISMVFGYGLLGFAMDSWVLDLAH